MYIIWNNRKLNSVFLLTSAIKHQYLFKVRPPMNEMFLTDAFRRVAGRLAIIPAFYVHK